MPSLTDVNKTTDNDRAEVVVTDETNGYLAEVTSSNELKVYQDKVIVTIDTIHNRVHAGEAFVFSWQGVLGSNQSKQYVVTTPNTSVKAHFMYNIASAKGVEIYLYENPNLSAGATQTAYNMNRNSATTNTTTIKAVSSVTSVGTLILVENLSGTSIAGNFFEQFVLKSNEEYLFRITSRLTANGSSIVLNWYETDDV